MDALLFEPLSQCREQDSLPVLPAVRLHQCRGVLTMDSPLPLDAFRVPSPARRRVVAFVQREVLDVDVVAGEKEVRLILPALLRRRRRRVRLFVPERDAVFGQVVRDLQLLEALD